MGIGNGGVFLLYRVSYYNFSSLILFESMYLCRRIISGCTAIVDDYLSCSIVSCRRSCVSHCLFYHHSLPFILEERMILYLFVGIVTAIFSSLFSSIFHHQKTLILSQIFISSSLLTFYILIITSQTIQ